MIKISDLKTGDFVMVNNEGAQMEAEVLEVDNSQHLVNLETNAGQSFWFGADDLAPIPLSDEALKKISFIREDQPDGSVKYLKGAFRLHVNSPGDFSHINFWYREDRRHVNQPIALHQLQNYYLQMTKVHLTAEPI